jgi:hypothetical protein
MWAELSDFFAVENLCCLEKERQTCIGVMVCIHLFLYLKYV